LKFKLKDSSNEETPVAEEIDSGTDPSVSISLTASKRDLVPPIKVPPPRYLQELSEIKARKDESDKKAEGLSSLVHQLEQSLETNRIQVKTQENLLLKKEEELIQLRSAANRKEHDIKCLERKIKDSKATESETAQQEIEKVKEEARALIQQNK